MLKELLKAIYEAQEDLFYIRKVFLVIMEFPKELDVPPYRSIEIIARMTQDWLSDNLIKHKEYKNLLFNLIHVNRNIKHALLFRNREKVTNIDMDNFSKQLDTYCEELKELIAS